LRAAIVGTGIAGLASAIYLRRAGCDVRLVERAPQPAPIGSGLLLQPPGLAVLEDLGLLDAALARGARIVRLDGRTRTGRRVIGLDYRDWSPRAFGLGMHRGALWHLLEQRACSEGVTMEAGREIESVDELEEFDLVLLACGARAAIRGTLGLRDRSRSYAWGALWATVPMPADWNGETLAQRFDGTAKMMGILPVGRDSQGAGPWVTLFWSERLDRIDALRARGWDAWREDALRIWPGAHPIVESLPGFEAFTTGAYTDVRVAPWVRGRVALVGDIAHGTSPQLGQGATLALLDARALAAAMAGEARPEDALLAYARARRDHARYYQWSSRMLTPFFQSDRRWLGLMRDAFMGPLGSLPILRREFLATLTGHKSGIVFGRLEP
jgi:2-polyprenyl-6-methoxyphenol hydroxylase-like FAD-dependent oxidoreductase